MSASTADDRGRTRMAIDSPPLTGAGSSQSVKMGSSSGTPPPGAVAAPIYLARTRETAISLATTVEGAPSSTVDKTTTSGEEEDVGAGAVSGLCSDVAPDVLSRERRVVPLPFVRKLRLQMDSCPGTNKFQVFYGGLGFRLTTAVLDCAMVVYMVVGHTKFGPDLEARQVAGTYNQSDCFNHAQLLNLMLPHATAGVYDDHVLQT